MDFARAHGQLGGGENLDDSSLHYAIAEAPLLWLKHPLPRCRLDPIVREVQNESEALRWV
jgi:hypothetical protein